jgi:hypothetical protein
MGMRQAHLLTRREFVRRSPGEFLEWGASRMGVTNSEKLSADVDPPRSDYKMAASGGRAHSRSKSLRP